MRIVTDLNDGWLFGKKCETVPEIVPEGSDWEQVTLPHTWNAIDGMIGVPFERGAYWYVRSFEAPKQPLPGGRTYIEVGAAGQSADIYVNGDFVCHHTGGYSAFRADLTHFLKDGENLLAIRVDNLYSDKVYPQRADFTFYGGLYRYVRLISVAESHISLDEYGGPGVYIDAVPTDGSALVTAKVLLKNPKEGQRVSLQILDPENTVSSEEVISEAWDFAEPETVLKACIPNARLWDKEYGYPLYTAVLRIVSFNEVIDEIMLSFGVRSFALDPEQGFFLNGRAYPLRGVCRHQDRLYLGNALEEYMAFDDAEMIADMGANTVRLAHYQQAQEMYDACDLYGLVVWAEIPYFAQSWDDEAHQAAVNEIKELVAQNYHHPSICFWGLSNEILIGGNDNPKLLQCHKDLNDAVKSLDPNRITVIAHEYGAGWDHPLHQSSDAEGWNHYFGWYRGQRDDLAKWCDEYHGKYPERAFAVTEYGCDAVISYHSDDPAKMDYTEEYQVLVHENACETFTARPYVWGSFVWNMFDFGSNFRREGGTKGRNNKGLVSMDRKIKKDSYYVYKAWFSEDPFVHIDGRRYFIRPTAETTVRVHSNAEEVSLYVDGKLFETQKGAHTFIFEHVPISKEGTVLTACAGEQHDTITLRSADGMPEAFTFPGFKETQDAINWFESVEEAAGTLERKEGYFSVHDSLADVVADPEAKKAFLSAVTAAAERALPEQMLLSGDLSGSVSDVMSGGILQMLLGKKAEQTLRRLQAVLLTIKKK